ncbi:MAG: copper resistance protein CopC [Chloroflexota bacterium]|nr:copper resistance protein CopC [Chloroflexota bacterium]
MVRILRWAACLLLLALHIHTTTVGAHSNLERSEPTANASLAETPEEIRLWFTEPLEAAFSSFRLLDSNGIQVDTPASQLDPVDEHQLFMDVTALPDGLYTVVWYVVSGTDGHATEGSFSFGINAAPIAATLPPVVEPVITPESTIIRSLHLLAASLTVGGIGFRLFAWFPVISSSAPSGNRWQRWLVVSGWVALGVVLAGVLMLQTSISGNLDLWNTLTDPALMTVLTQTTFGTLWLVRAALWVLLGGILWLAYKQRRGLWVAFFISGVLLLIHSLFSHASAVEDSVIAIVVHWLHSFVTALWLGGLAAFAGVLVASRSDNTLPVGSVSRLTAAFSNYARVLVAALVISGSYAAWLHIGSLEALFTTNYGMALLLKLILFMPLLVIAAINLVWTQRRLVAGDEVWVSRLRGLIGVEIALLCTILLLVGMMTAGNPARATQALRSVVYTIPETEPYFGMEMSGNQMMHLEIIPGYVGENEFILMPLDEQGEPITDASLIRMRFENRDQNLGRSELRPQATGMGVYSASGVNLSMPGEWRIRVTLQRPGEFDTVLDFDVEIPPAPLPSASPVDMSIPLVQRAFATSLVGGALVCSGGYFILRRYDKSLSGGRILALITLAIGVLALLTAIAVP